jgi:sRNA-binding carbon storage regulator CsrA
MLILRRRSGESVTISTSDGPIRIVLSIVPGPMGPIFRFAIDAPQACRVVRDDAVVRVPVEEAG